MVSADLDELDRAIVSALQADGRMPFRRLARQLGISEAAVRRRFGRLRRSGLIQVLATGDPLKFGIHVDAITLVRSHPGQAELVAEQLAAMREVRYVALALGSADIVVESLHPSVEHLFAFLTGRLAGLEGIASRETLQVVRIVKNSWDWRPWLAWDSRAPSAGPPPAAGAPAGAGEPATGRP